MKARGEETKEGDVSTAAATTVNKDDGAETSQAVNEDHQEDEAKDQREDAGHDEPDRGLSPLLDQRTKATVL